jgi:hypothetical protein
VTQEFKADKIKERLLSPDQLEQEEQDEYGDDQNSNQSDQEDDFST